MNAVKKLIKCDKRYTFELFGYDFMISDDGNVYLIEVNTNPCLEESCSHLKKIMQRMISILLLISFY
jgi:tubulin--tyrosine ligase